MPSQTGATGASQATEWARETFLPYFAGWESRDTVVSAVRGHVQADLSLCPAART